MQVTMYYRNATAAFLVYDITDNSSFLQIKSWVDGNTSLLINRSVSTQICHLELNRYVGNPVVMCVLANKSDLEETREVDSKLGREYADSIGALFFETSAQSNSGLSCFNTMDKSNCVHKRCCVKASMKLLRRWRSKLQNSIQNAWKS